MRLFIFWSLISYNSVRIEHYTTQSGITIFEAWLKHLRDPKGKAAITRRLEAVEVRDHVGDCRRVGDGVWEMRIDTGPGYRLYFGYNSMEAVVMLIGGDKSTQRRDIRQALRHWRDWQSRTKMQYLL